MRVFAAQDSKLGVFLTPFMRAHLGQALREWEEICVSSDTMIAKHPMDFALYEIGEYDDSSGLLSPISPLKLVETAAAVVARKQSAQSKLPLA